MEVVKSILLYLWQLPQNIVGLVLLLFMRPTELKEKAFDCAIRTSSKMRGGISVGRYIFVRYYPLTMADKGFSTILHEIGHQKQSRLLGPLYLLVIGIPSLLWAATHRYIAPKKSYYWFYTEMWANKLMGLNIK